MTAAHTLKSLLSGNPNQSWWKLGWRDLYSVKFSSVRIVVCYQYVWLNFHQAFPLKSAGDWSPQGAPALLEKPGENSVKHIDNKLDNNLRVSQCAGLVNNHNMWFAMCVIFFRTRLVKSFIDNLDRVWQLIESFPRTLVHYDFTPRNVCIRKREMTTKDKQSEFITESRLRRVSCVYDWEMATIHAPQHDVVEFLAFVLPAKSDVTVRANFVRFYQEQLEKFSGRTFDPEQFMDVFNAVCCVYALHQLSLKTITHSVTRLPYFERAVQSHMEFLEDLEAMGRLEFLNVKPF